MTSTTRSCAPHCRWSFASKPDVVFYLAGADPFEGDQLGGLALTRAASSNAIALSSTPARPADRPVSSVTLAGGYARAGSKTPVAIHRATIELAARTFTERRGPSESARGPSCGDLLMRRGPSRSA